MPVRYLCLAIWPFGAALGALHRRSNRDVSPEHEHQRTGRGTCDLKFRALGAAPILLLLSFFAVPANAGTYTIYTSGDSYFDSDRPNDNYGSNATLDVRTKSGDNERAVFQFDLSSIPAGETVTSAVLQIYVSTANASVTTNIHRVTDTWTESTVTWANTNADYDATADGSFVPNSTGLKTATITSLVQEWRSGTANYGIMFISSGNDTRSSYWSEEAASSANFPRLVVTTASAPNIALTKVSQVLQDPLNGSTNPKRIPGSTIRYTISATNTGAGAASNVVVTDPIPLNMTYVSGSMTLASASLTDASDVDAGAYNSGTRTITVNVGTLAANTGSATITFDATVN